MSLPIFIVIDGIAISIWSVLPVEAYIIFSSQARMTYTFTVDANCFNSATSSSGRTISAAAMASSTYLTLVTSIMGTVLLDIAHAVLTYAGPISYLSSNSLNLPISTSI